ncbi:hypothetical protein JKP88DRAFT_338234 [Tribonema minus]|uniref:Uncharacterized protein n=1 Tax=Tribonema minus TaxID=303371 RepID=A0A836C7G9_9STRA|nr:hypothetical protein JKP88DRAFT_338234 [Tribonema minus]
MRRARYAVATGSHGPPPSLIEVASVMNDVFEPLDASAACLQHGALQLVRDGLAQSDRSTRALSCELARLLTRHPTPAVTADAELMAAVLRGAAAQMDEWLEGLGGEGEGAAVARARAELAQTYGAAAALQALAQLLNAGGVEAAATLDRDGVAQLTRLVAEAVPAARWRQADMFGVEHGHGSLDQLDALYRPVAVTATGRCRRPPPQAAATYIPWWCKRAAPLPLLLTCELTASDRRPVSQVLLLKHVLSCRSHTSVAHTSSAVALLRAAAFHPSVRRCQKLDLAGCAVLLALARSPRTVGLLMDEVVIATLVDTFSAYDADGVWASGLAPPWKLAAQALRRMADAFLKRAVAEPGCGGTDPADGSTPTALAYTEANDARVREMLASLPPFSSRSWQLSAALEQPPPPPRPPAPPPPRSRTYPPVPRLRTRAEHRHRRRPRPPVGRCEGVLGVAAHDKYNRCNRQEHVTAICSNTPVPRLSTCAQSTATAAALALPWGAARAYWAWRRGARRHAHLALPRPPLLRAGLTAMAGAVAAMALYEGGLRTNNWLLWRRSAPSVNRQVAFETALTAAQGVCLFALLRAAPYCLLPAAAGLYMFEEVGWSYTDPALIQSLG